MYKKYGKDAYRMFRLLSKTGRLLETDKVISLNGWICSQFHCNSSYDGNHVFLSWFTV